MLRKMRPRIGMDGFRIFQRQIVPCPLDQHQAAVRTRRCKFISIPWTQPVLSTGEHMNRARRIRHEAAQIWSRDIDLRMVRMRVMPHVFRHLDNDIPNVGILAMQSPQSIVEFLGKNGLKPIHTSSRDASPSHFGIA